MSSLPDGEGYISARIRAGTQTPCAATDLADPGDRLVIGAGRLLGAFSVAGSYAADEPGTYLICAWIVDGFNESGPARHGQRGRARAGPAAHGTAPARVSPAEPFDVTVGYEAEVSRYLTVLVVRGTRCPIKIRTLGAIVDPPAALTLDNVEATGPGSATGTVRLTQAGTYSACGYLDEPPLGSERPHLVVKVAAVSVIPPIRGCGSIGGRRAIHSIRARGVSCTTARSLARRWGAPRRAPQRIGAYRCFARSGSVTCTAGAAQVRFRFGRRSG